MSSQPTDHTSWKLPASESHPPSSMNITFHPGANLAANPHFSRALPIANAPAAASVQPQPTSARKRQFRFSVRADIDLLKLVIKNNPYAAPHGGRLHKWQAIADTLREGGIDIDFRRARDRTGLLLDQWREQELSLLRRSASGNQQDQAQKEQLLQRISEIEQAARPRDNSADWRSRDHSRSRTPQAASGPRHTTLPHADNPTTQPALNVIGPADPRAAKFGDIQSSSLHSQGQLPPLMQKHDSHTLPQARVDTDLQTLQYGTHQGPPEKQFKNNHGQALSPRFTQPLFGQSSSPKAGPSHAQPSQDRRSPPRSEMSPHRSDLPLLRPGQPVHRNNPHVLGSAPLDVGPVHAVTSSPRLGEGQNIQLDTVQAGLPRHSPESETEQLRARILRLEKRLEDISQMAKKHLEYEERRLQWDQERENKRLQLEKDRIEKEYEDRRAEREERRRRDESEKEERQRVLNIILRSHQQPQSGSDNPI
eukprot:GFKZ01010819.1.p2 GENE.GFKZ01010819.1~~GFKZ01010819.1.p2  ORF type:complete len:480 (-),score=70.15 GFKZ01010819.1:2965-4404(-)